MWNMVPKSLFLIPLSFAFYFVPEVGVGAQKFDFKSHLSFAFYFVLEVRVGAQKFHQITYQLAQGIKFSFIKFTQRSH